MVDDNEGTPIQDEDDPDFEEVFEEDNALGEFPPKNIPPPMPPPPFIDWEEVRRYHKLKADRGPDGMTAWARTILMNEDVIGLDSPDQWWWRTAAIAMAMKWMSAVKLDQK